MMAPTPAAFAASSVASVTSMGWLRIWCPAILPTYGAREIELTADPNTAR